MALRQSLYLTAVSQKHDLAALLADQWAKIGVEVEMDGCGVLEYNRRRYPTTTTLPDWQGTLLDGLPSANPLTMLELFHVTGAGQNYGVYSNPEVDELIARIAVEMDVAEQTRLLKEVSLVYMRDVPRIPLHLSSERIYWWPWLKNYYGEYSLCDGQHASLLPYMWIDQDLKTEMGY